MFEKFNFTKGQIERFFKSAQRDLKIALASDEIEVIFLFSYNALIKIAIAVCAQHGFRIKSQQEHHRELIEKLAEYLENDDIEVIGNEMRTKRNWDFYDGGITVSEKEANEYRIWVEGIVKKSN